MYMTMAHANEMRPNTKPSNAMTKLYPVFSGQSRKSSPLFETTNTAATKSDNAELAKHNKQGTANLILRLKKKVTVAKMIVVMQVTIDTPIRAWASVTITPEAEPHPISLVFTPSQLSSSEVLLHVLVRFAILFPDSVTKHSPHGDQDNQDDNDECKTVVLLVELLFVVELLATDFCTAATQISVSPATGDLKYWPGGQE